MNKDRDNFYPLLPEEGKKEAQSLINAFKDKLKRVADEVIGDLYCDVSCYIESDNWLNFRNQLLEGFKNYGNSKIHNMYDFKKIRQSILKNHREDIIKDLNQDMLEEIERLKECIKSLKKEIK